ncbi:unnamed protein product, partial [Tetraodon nigroviridis]
GGCLIDQSRRKSILLSNILILSGSVILLISSYFALLFGRMIVGFGMCISSMSCCIFVSEMVTPDSRGFLATLYESGITVGILGAYAVNYMLSNCTTGWKWMFGLAVVPTLIQLFCVCGIPSNTEESLHQREADTSMLCYGASNHRVNLSLMDFFKKKNNMRTRTTIGLSLVLFQQFTGQPNVLSYASTIFHSVGFQSDASALLASLGLGCVKVCATLTSTMFSDRVGRRPLLISGCSVMALCLISIALLRRGAALDAINPCDSELSPINGTKTLPTVVDNPTVEAFLAGAHNDGLKPLEPPLESIKGQDLLSKWIIFLCMIAVVSAYSAGFGPMTWLLLSEIFPADIRGRAYAFINCFNWGANLLVTVSFLNSIQAVGVSGIFLLYGALASLAGIFFFFVLPETKGKTLEEIDLELCLNRCSVNW